MRSWFPCLTLCGKTNFSWAVAKMIQLDLQEMTLLSLPGLDLEVAGRRRLSHQVRHLLKCLGLGGCPRFLLRNLFAAEVKISNCAVQQLFSTMRLDFQSEMFLCHYSYTQGKYIYKAINYKPWEVHKENMDYNYKSARTNWDSQGLDDALTGTNPWTYCLSVFWWLGPVVCDWSLHPKVTVMMPTRAFRGTVRRLTVGRNGRSNDWQVGHISAAVASASMNSVQQLPFNDCNCKYVRFFPHKKRSSCELCGARIASGEMSPWLKWQQIRFITTSTRQELRTLEPHHGPAQSSQEGREAPRLFSRFKSMDQWMFWMHFAHWFHQFKPLTKAIH